MDENEGKCTLQTEGSASCNSNSVESTTVPDGQKRDDSSEGAFNMKECEGALKDDSSPVKDASSDSEGEEFSDAGAVPQNVEYDETHLKQLYDDLPEEERKECKEQATALKNKGNAEYKSKNFKEAVSLYTQALNSCPLEFTVERSILYANRAAAYVGLEKNENAVADCDKALDLNPDYLKARIRRAQLHRKMDNLEKCLEDYKEIIKRDPGNSEAREACVVLPPQIHERNEKLKQEMLGKLKDLGNLVLRPFGLSTNNFNVVQDPNSGGYSINFQNNPK